MTTIKVKSPNEILEMPINAKIESPTKHNPKIGPNPKCICQAILPDTAQNDGRSKPQVAIEIDTWKLAKDRNGGIVHPLRITHRDDESQEEEEPVDLPSDRDETAGEMTNYEKPAKYEMQRTVTHKGELQKNEMWILHFRYCPEGGLKCQDGRASYFYALKKKCIFYALYIILLNIIPYKSTYNTLYLKTHELHMRFLRHLRLSILCYSISC